MIKYYTLKIMIRQLSNRLIHFVNVVYLELQLDRGYLNSNKYININIYK